MKVASDLHINPLMTDAEIERIVKFQALPGRKVYSGDVYELTWFVNIKDCRAYKEFNLRLKPDDILLYGNHDVSMKKEWQESFYFDGFLIMHGHQFDKLAGGCSQKTYYKLAPYVKNIWLKSPLEQKMAGDTEWHRHNGQIWGNAIKWLEDQHLTGLVIGHTHDSAVITRPQRGKVLFALGGLPEDGVYFDFDSMSIQKI